MATLIEAKCSDCGHGVDARGPGGICIGCPCPTWHGDARIGVSPEGAIVIVPDDDGEELTMRTQAAWTVLACSSCPWLRTGTTDLDGTRTGPTCSADANGREVGPRGHREPPDFCMLRRGPVLVHLGARPWLGSSDSKAD